MEVCWAFNNLLEARQGKLPNPPAVRRTCRKRCAADFSVEGMLAADYRTTDITKAAADKPVPGAVCTADGANRKAFVTFV